MTTVVFENAFCLFERDSQPDTAFEVLGATGEKKGSFALECLFEATLQKRPLQLESLENQRQGLAVALALLVMTKLGIGFKCVSVCLQALDDLQQKVRL